MSLEGGCLCGGMRFVVEGPVSPVQLCHARRCQRSTGSAFAPELGCRAADFRWLRGEALQTVYEAPLLREPPAYRKGFCSRCGSPMPVKTPESRVVVFLAGVLDEGDALSVLRKIHLRDAPAWLDATPHAESYEGSVPPESRRPWEGR